MTERVRRDAGRRGRHTLKSKLTELVDLPGLHHRASTPKKAIPRPRAPLRRATPGDQRAICRIQLPRQLCDEQPLDPGPRPEWDAADPKGARPLSDGCRAGCVTGVAGGDWGCPFLGAAGAIRRGRDRCRRPTPPWSAQVAYPTPCLRTMGWSTPTDRGRVGVRGPWRNHGNSMQAPSSRKHAHGEHLQAGRNDGALSCGTRWGRFPAGAASARHDRKRLGVTTTEFYPHHRIDPPPPAAHRSLATADQPDPQGRLAPRRSTPLVFGGVSPQSQWATATTLFARAPTRCP